MGLDARNLRWTIMSYATAKTKAQARSGTEMSKVAAQPSTRLRLYLGTIENLQAQQEQK